MSYKVTEAPTQISDKHLGAPRGQYVTSGSEDEGAVQTSGIRRGEDHGLSSEEGCRHSVKPVHRRGHVGCNEQCYEAPQAFWSSHLTSVCPVGFLSCFGPISFYISIPPICNGDVLACVIIRWTYLTFLLIFTGAHG